MKDWTVFELHRIDDSKESKGVTDHDLWPSIVRKNRSIRYIVSKLSLQTYHDGQVRVLSHVIRQYSMPYWSSHWICT